MSMTSRLLNVSTATINTVFVEDITAIGGRILDTLDDGKRLYARAMLPAVEEVQPQDKLQGGVALRATDGAIVLCPYVFRQVCTNGLIVAQSGQTRRLTLDEFGLAEPYLLFELRTAIQACCQLDEFRSNVESMRASLTQFVSPALVALEVSTQFLWIQSAGLDQALSQVLAEFDREQDHTRFGLMNAVTAVGRDTRDPELRWRLEECGAKIGLGPQPKPTLSSAQSIESPADSNNSGGLLSAEDADSWRFQEKRRRSLKKR